MKYKGVFILRVQVGNEKREWWVIPRDPDYKEVRSDFLSRYDCLKKFLKINGIKIYDVHVSRYKGIHSLAEAAMTIADIKRGMV